MKIKLSDVFTIDTDEEPWRTEGLRVCIFGGPGSGKSYTAALFAEQFLENGGSVIIFQPRAEYHTLKERFSNIIVVGAPMKKI